MKDRDIDDIVKRAASEAPGVDPALLVRVTGSIASGLQPVRPLPPTWILSGRLGVISGSLALAGAMLLKPYGVQRMSALEIGLIFPVVGILAWIASVLCVAEVIPGSRRPMAPWLLSACGCLGLAAVFVVLFHDYRVERFVSHGVPCLTAGLALALPASIAAWLLLRRGFAVNSAGAGLAKGTLAGLAGVAMLELHCPIFEVPHLLVWHIAVLPVCGVVGALVARTQGRPPTNHGPGPGRRLLFSTIGLLAGNAALPIYLMIGLLFGALWGRVAWLNACHALPDILGIFVSYAIFSILGWAFVGFPIVLAFPARLLSRVRWPLCALIGAALGPLALLLIFFVIFAMQGRVSAFSLAHTEALWQFSILVSTVSFLVYVALLRKRSPNGG